MISCLLLSAGLSQRFGSPKALADFKGEPVIVRLQNMLVNSQVDEIIVVLGAHADSIKLHLLDHTKIKFVYNKDYNFGQTSSFKAGLQELSGNSQGVMLLPIDFPLVGGQTVNALVKYFIEQQPLILIPTFKGKKGHPPLFSLSLRDEFLNLDNNVGINSIIHAHQEQMTALCVDDSGVVASFNTQEELKNIAGSC